MYVIFILYHCVFFILFAKNFGFSPSDILFIIFINAFEKKAILAIWFHSADDKSIFNILNPGSKLKSFPSNWCMFNNFCIGSYFFVFVSLISSLWKYFKCFWCYVYITDIRSTLLQSIFLAPFVEQFLPAIPCQEFIRPGTSA